MTEPLTFKVAAELGRSYGYSGPHRDYDLGVATRIIEMVQRPSPRDVETLREMGAALLGHIDMFMPAIERALRAEWDRGNYINGPKLGATIEALRSALASAGEAGTATTPQSGVVHEHAVGEAETP